MKKFKLFLFSLVMGLLANGLYVGTAVAATCAWTGAAGDGLWATATNWSACTGGGVPTSSDSVVLDNSILTGSYAVTLPDSTNNTTIQRLTITPDSGNNITLILPVSNTGTPGFTVGDNTANTDDIILNDGAILINSSGATAATTGIALSSMTNGTFRINNGGRYIHNTNRASSDLAARLSTVAGTEYGVWEFDVPGTGSYSIGAVNRSYGSLVLTRASRTYSTSGSTGSLTVRGNLTINSGVTFNHNMTSAVSTFIAGNWINHGVFNANSTNVVFNGSQQQVISGSSVTNFNNVVVNSGASVFIPTTATAVSLTNNGAVKQTQDVTSAGNVTFLGLGGYGGVVINPHDKSLGDTTVTIYKAFGVGASCAQGDPTVERCFIITPELEANRVDRNATIRFYFDKDVDYFFPSDCNILIAYHYVGGGNWELAGKDGNGDPDGGTATCNVAPAYVEVASVHSFSYFALADNVEAPTAVTLQSLTAASALSLPFLLIAALFTGLAAAATAVVLRRRATA